MDENEFRNVGHQVVELLADYLASIDRQPLSPQIDPGTLHELFDEPLPQHGVEAQAILKELQEKLFPNCVHVSHPVDTDPYSKHFRESKTPIQR